MVLTSDLLGLDKDDTYEEIQVKIDKYFDENLFTQDIIEMTRKKPTGDFNMYMLNLNTSDYTEIEDKYNFIIDGVLELSRLQENKKYNIKIYSDFYENNEKVSSEEILSINTTENEKIQMIYYTQFMNEGGKRNFGIDFIQNEEVIGKLDYYIPSNYNETGYVNDADFDVNEDLPIISFTRGHKVGEKYETHSPMMHKDKDKIEKSIEECIYKNDKMVILRIEVNEI